MRTSAASAIVTSVQIAISHVDTRSARWLDTEEVEAGRDWTILREPGLPDALEDARPGAAMKNYTPTSTDRKPRSQLDEAPTFRVSPVDHRAPPADGNRPTSGPSTAGCHGGKRALDLRQRLVVGSRLYKSKGGTMATKRTTHRSSSGKKLYAVRDKAGRFKDIQTYKRAHSQDIKRKAKSEK